MNLFTILFDYGQGQYQYNPPCEYIVLRGLLADLNREHSRRSGEAAPALSYATSTRVLTVRFSLRWIFTDPEWLIKLSRWEIMRLKEGERILLPINEDQMKVILKGCRVSRMKISYERVNAGAFSVGLEPYRSIREKVIEAALQCTHTGIAFVPMDPIDMQTARTYISQAKGMLKHPVTASYDEFRRQMVLKSDNSEGGRLLEELVTCGDEDKMNEVFEAYKALYFGRKIEEDQPKNIIQEVDI